MRLQKQSGKSTILSAAPILVRPVAIGAGLLSSRLRLDKTTGQQASTNRTSKDEHAHARTSTRSGQTMLSQQCRRARRPGALGRELWCAPGRGLRRGAWLVYPLSLVCPARSRHIYTICKVAPQRAQKKRKGLIIRGTQSEKEFPGRENHVFSTSHGVPCP